MIDTLRTIARKVVDEHVNTLTDVLITSVQDGDLLVYDNSIKKWVNSLSGGTTSLASLTDVTLTSPTANQLLQYNGTKWVNNTINSWNYAHSDITYTSFTTENFTLNPNVTYVMSRTFDLVSTEYQTQGLPNNVYFIQFDDTALGEFGVCNVILTLNNFHHTNFTFGCDSSNTPLTYNFAYVVNERRAVKLYLQISQGLITLISEDTEFYNPENTYTDMLYSYTGNTNILYPDNNIALGYWNSSIPGLIDTNPTGSGNYISLLFNTVNDKMSTCFGGNNLFLNVSNNTEIKGIAYFNENINLKSDIFYKAPTWYFGANVNCSNFASTISKTNPVFGGLSSTQDVGVITVCCLDFDWEYPIFDESLKAGNFPTAGILYADISFVDSSGNLMKFGCTNDGSGLQIISYQGKSIALGYDGIGGNAIGENFWSFQVVGGFVKGNNCGTNSTLYSTIDFNNSNSLFNYDYNVSGSNGGINRNCFTERQTEGVGPCIVPYSFVYDITNLMTVTHNSVVYTATGLFDLFNQLPYPFVPDPAHPIYFPLVDNLITPGSTFVYNWNTDLSLTTTITDIVFGNRIDLTVDEDSLDPSVSPTYSATSKAFMANKNISGEVTTGLVAATSIPTHDENETLYDIVYKNYLGRYIIF